MQNFKQNFLVTNVLNFLSEMSNDAHKCERKHMISKNVSMILITATLMSCSGGGGSSAGVGTGGGSGNSSISSSKLGNVVENTPYPQSPSSCVSYGGGAGYYNHTLIRLAGTENFQITTEYYTNNTCTTLTETSVIEFTFSSFAQANSTTDNITVTWVNSILVPAMNSATWNAQSRYGFTDWSNGIGKSIAGRSYDGIEAPQTSIGDTLVVPVEVNGSILTIDGVDYQL